MTTPNEAKEAIYKRFVDNFTLTDTEGNTISYFFGKEEGVFESETYILINAVDVASNQVTLGGSGNRKYEIPGLINIKIGTPIDKGQKVSDDIVLRLTDLFEGVTFNSIHTFNTTFRQGADDGYHVIHIMSIDYRIQRIK